MSNAQKNKIDSLVLKSKIGDREAFDLLYQMFSFLMANIYKSACEQYSFLIYRKFEIYQDFYICFCRCINKYKFSNDLGFSHDFQRDLWNSLFATLKNNFDFTDEMCLKIKKSKRVKKPFFLRKFVLSVLRTMTPKQKRIAYLYYYKEMTHEQICAIFGVKTDSVQRHIELIKKKIQARFNKVKGRAKPVIYNEKLHKLGERRRKYVET